MRYFPLFLDLRGRRVLLVGGGPVAERKFALLRAAGAAVVVVAPALTSALEAAVNNGQAVHCAREFTGADLDGARLVIAATDAALVNRAVAHAAEARSIWVNVVDDLELSTGILPAIVDRSPLTVAISTAGTAPALARFVRARIEESVDESLGRLATFLAAWRGRIKSGIADVTLRRRFYDWLLHGPVAGLVRNQRQPEAVRALTAALASGVQVASGSVVLVGAGPGDPGLLTLHALRALQSADVVLYDRLVSAEVLALARREAQLLPVGKSSQGHSVSQSRINELLVEHAQLGRRVVRLKGGDPFVFGRGGEELEHLARHGIRFEVVPGITAALACAAYAGIPLTHREYSYSLRFVTAHCHDSLDAIDWYGLARERETLAIYMGTALLGALRTKLLAHGRAASTPIALIENGSRPEQRVIVGTLEALESLAMEHSVRAPALLIIGETAALAARLHWFGAAPVGAGEAAEQALASAVAA